MSDAVHWRAARLAAILLVFVAAGSATEDVLSSHVRGPLTPARSDGKVILAYEVDITNTSGQDVSLVRLDAFADGASKPLLSYAQNELAQNSKQIAPPVSRDVRTLKPHGRVAVFCWTEFPAGATLPHALHHEIWYHVDKGPERDQVRSIRIGPAAVGEVSMVVLGAPLGPGTWWAGIGPSNTSQHRRAQVRVSGNSDAPFAQRFAIDWVELCDGRMSANRGASNADFCGYGKNVLAVASAQVAAVQDGIPDNKPGEGSRAVKVTLETLMGNHVVLDLGNHLYAVYAHLQPGSVKVKVGDRVERGQVIGLLGNSGNSDAPHLHFHVGQAESVDQVESVQTEPVPYGFDRFELVGLYAGHGMMRPGNRQIRGGELPLDQEVVRFAGID